MIISRIRLGGVSGGGVTGTASGTLSALTGSVSGSSVNNPSGAASASLQAVTGDASGSFTPLAVTGTASGALSQVTGAASGSYTPQAISGTGDGTLSPVTGSASGAFSSADFNGTGAVTLQAVTGSASGSSVDNITGTADGNLNAVVGDASGTVVNPAIVGTGAGTLQAITGYAIESVPGAGGKKKRKPWDEGKGYRRVAEEQEEPAHSEQEEGRNARKITLKPTQNPVVSDWPLVELDREIAKTKSAITTHQATPDSSQMVDDLQRVYEAKIMLRYLENERLRKLEEEALLLLMVV